mgnify:CR=1 FL=1
MTTYRDDMKRVAAVAAAAEEVAFAEATEYERERDRACAAVEVERGRAAAELAALRKVAAAARRLSRRCTTGSAFGDALNDTVAALAAYEKVKQP